MAKFHGKFNLLLTLLSLIDNGVYLLEREIMLFQVVNLK